MSLLLFKRPCGRGYWSRNFTYRLVLNCGATSLDNNGKYRERVKNFDKFYEDDSELAKWDKWDQEKIKHASDRQQRLLWKRTLEGVFNSVGLLDENRQIRTDLVIEDSILERFANFCRKHRGNIGNLLDISIRHDLRKKPAQQLGKFLALIGIRWAKLKPVKQGKSKIYRYQVPVSQLEQVQTIVARRRDRALRDDWEEKRERMVETDGSNASKELRSVRRTMRAR